MEEKIELPVELVTGLLQACITPHGNLRGKRQAQEGWVLALFESFGSWHPACETHGLWHVAVSYTGMCTIDEGSKHVNIPMDLSHKSMGDVLHAAYH